MSNNIKSEFITVGSVVLSYVDQLFVPREKDRDDGTKSQSFSCNIIFDQNVLAQIEPLVEQVGAQAFPNEWNIPNRVKKPIRDTAEKPETYGSRFPGHKFAAVKTQFAPTIVDQNKNVVTANIPDPSRTDGQKLFYGGTLAYVNINVWSFRHPTGGPSVSLGLQAVMKVGDSEPLIESGSVDVNSVFANVPVNPGAAVPPAGQMQQAPVQQAQVPVQQAQVPVQQAQAPVQQAQAPVQQAQAPVQQAQVPVQQVQAQVPAFDPNAGNGFM